MSAILKEHTSGLRPMLEQDLDQVADLEREAYSDPWPQRSFQECLRFGHSCWVVAREELVQGYGIMSVELDTAHILNLCVGVGFQRQGIGRFILDHLLQVASAQGVGSVFLEVRASNVPAIRLYLSRGFVEVGIRKNYYPKGPVREDALIFVHHTRRRRGWGPREVEKRS